MKTCHEVSVETIYAEKTGSEEMAEELQESLGDFDPNVAEGEQPVLDVGVLNGLECVVDHNYELLTHNQVLKRWKRTPRTLRIRGVKVKVPGKPNATKHVRYPFPKTTTLKVRCRYGVHATQQLVPSRAKQFENGGSMMVDSTFDTMMQGSNVLSLFRLKTKNSVDRQVKSEDGVLEGSDDEAVDNASGSNEEGEESENADGTFGRLSATPADGSSRSAPAKKRLTDTSMSTDPSLHSSASGGKTGAALVAICDDESESEDAISDDMGNVGSSPYRDPPHDGTLDHGNAT
jgi:hypothetical protein